MVCAYETTKSLMISPYPIVALEIVRSRGLFGRVTVLYEVTNNASDGMYARRNICNHLDPTLLFIDLSMVTGGVVFEANIDSMVFKIIVK